MSSKLMRYPMTPDGRYFVVRGRLWRCTNAALSVEKCTQLTHELMHYRVTVGQALRAQDKAAEKEARTQVHKLKVALGERGAV